MYTRRPIFNLTRLRPFQEDIKSLCSHVVENYGQILDKITYVQTFKALKLRYDQHQDRLRDPQTGGGGRMGGGGGGGQLESVGSILRPGRFKRDPREMDEDEEMWFNDDEFDNDAANGSNGNGGDNASEEDEEAAAPVPTSSAAAAVVAAPENQARDFTSAFDS